MHEYNPLRGIAAQVVTPTGQWCADNVVLSPRIPTARPGPWRESNVAALFRPGGPVCALDDPAVETVVVCKGSQTAMTTTALAWLARCLVLDSGAAMIVMNSTTDARDKSAETWRPIWEDSPSLRKYLPADRRTAWTRAYQLIRGSPVYWIGANSAGRLGAKPVRWLVLDEVDKYPSKFGARGNRREGGAVSLAEQRTKTFRQSALAKILKFSTPTNDRGEIWTAYLQGDQRKLRVPCPACGVSQVMVWGNWAIDLDRAEESPDEVIAGARYVCPHCRAAWTDEQRFAAIDAGVWEPTAKPQDPRCVSYLLPSWCSKMVTTRYLAAERIKAATSPGGLHGFINGECGEAYIRYETMVRHSEFAGLEGEYREGERFMDAAAYKEQYASARGIVIGGVDVQKGYLVAAFRQFADNGDSGLIWAGAVASLDELEVLAARWAADWVFVDTRYRTREIHEFVARNPGKGYACCVGVTRRKVLYTYSEIDIDIGRSDREGGRIVPVVEHDPDQLKDMLASYIQRAQGAPRWLIYAGMAARADYTGQMTAERCVNGRWINARNAANHYWDAEVLALLGCVWARGVGR